MSGYFGTATQQRLQAQAEAAAIFAAETAGACQAGRMAGCDDPERLGWEKIDEILRRDGICGFRLLRAAQIDDLTARMAARGYRFDTWDVHVGDAAACRDAASDPIEAHLPSGLVEIVFAGRADDALASALQQLMGAAGIVPFSASMLAGEFGRARTLALLDPRGAPVAVAHCYMPHNRYSRYHFYAWGGLVAVSPPWRGKGLGRYINGRMAKAAFDELEATHLYQLVSISNDASVRMVAATGLSPDPELVCGVATAMEQSKFTR